MDAHRYMGKPLGVTVTVGRRSALAPLVAATIVGPVVAVVAVKAVIQHCSQDACLVTVKAVGISLPTLYKGTRAMVMVVVVLMRQSQVQCRITAFTATTAFGSESSDLETILTQHSEPVQRQLRIEL
jgi:hypothetical protein